MGTKRHFRQPIWAIPLVIAALVALIGKYGDTRLRRTIETQLRAELTETLEANVTALHIWMTNQSRLAALVAEEPAVRKLSLAILDKPPVRGDLRGGPPESPELNQFNNLLRARLRRVNYDAAELVSTNFVVAANSGPGRMRLAGLPVSEAQTNRFAELFASGRPFIITPYKPEPPPGLGPPPGSGRDGPGRFRGNGKGGGGGRDRGEPREPGRGRRGDLTLMQVAAPITSDAGTVRGALALIIDPDREFTRMLSVARRGESGETYAFDQHGLLLSRSRFDDQLHKLGLLDATNNSSALNLRLHDPGVDLTAGYVAPLEDGGARELTHAVAAAAAGTAGIEVIPSRDYRGVPVVAAWRWLPEQDFGVVTQIDAAEAYQPLRWLRVVFSLLTLVMLLCACVLFLFSYRDLVWRRRLDEAELKLEQLGQYTLEQKIGEGGMGVVYRARHALMRRDTAVKLLPPDRADAASVERFEREVCLTCQLSHPNTIQIYDYGHTPEGVFYYVMELLNGLTLQDLVGRFGPQHEARVIHILLQVCDSLGEAHALGLIHRDIKPANVFLCHRGGVADWVKVLDFGLVRLYGARTTGDGTTTEERALVGTPWFMPPESIRNPALSDPRSDLYAVGAVAFFLLTGAYVFEGESVLEIYQKQLTEMPRPPGERSPQPVSAEMDEIVMACLAREPELRPQSAADLRVRLEACPLACAWSIEDRGEWWGRHQPQTWQSSDTPTPVSTGGKTVRMSLPGGTAGDGLTT